MTHPATIRPAATLPATILRGAAEHSTTPVIFDSATRPVTTTVGALVADAERAAGALVGLGVRPGDVVAVAVPNSYDGAIAQTAILLCGATLLPIVLSYGPRELGFILRQSRASVMIVAARYRGRSHPAMLADAGALPALRTMIVINGTAPQGMLTWAEVTGSLAKPFAAPQCAPDDRALLVYTSGTTAEPKGVQHTHRSLLAEIATPLLDRDTGPSARHLAVFPSGHVAGLLGLLRILVVGASTVVMDTWDTARAARLIDEHAVSSSVGAPIHLAGLLDERDAGRASLASLREYMVGAAGVPVALVERADAAGIAPYRCYGSSEHPTISSGTPADPLAKRAGTDGRPVAGNEVRIVDADGYDVASGSDGEILTRGPELFAGYTDLALNRQAFLPGRWFRTGDIGRIDAEGYLTITDRKKDIIVRGGENLSSKEIEDILVQHPRVTEAAAIGVADERYGERVCAVVVLCHGATLDVDEVGTHFAAAGAARNKTPESVVVVDTLPRTAAGKIQKHVVRAQLRGALTHGADTQREDQS